MRRVAIQAAGVLLVAASMLLGSSALATSDLSHQEDEERALFLTGQINAPPPYALVGAGDVRIPATAIPCASCHGHDGRGRAERGIEPPNITWPALLASNRGSGPKRPPYSETSVIRAITMGIGADGNRLDPIMPRFQLTSADAAALLTYLKRLGTLPQPGLDDHALALGTVVVGPDAAVGSVLSAYFAKISQDGGLFGRQLGLRTEKLAGGETPGRGTARDQIRRHFRRARPGHRRRRTWRDRDGGRRWDAGHWTADVKRTSRAAQPLRVLSQRRYGGRGAGARRLCRHVAGLAVDRRRRHPTLARNCSRGGGNAVGRRPHTKAVEPGRRRPHPRALARSFGSRTKHRTKANSEPARHCWCLARWGPRHFRMAHRRKPGSPLPPVSLTSRRMPKQSSERWLPATAREPKTGRRSTKRSQRPKF